MLLLQNVSKQHSFSLLFSVITYFSHCYLSVFPDIYLSLILQALHQTESAFKARAESHPDSHIVPHPALTSGAGTSEYLLNDHVKKI